MEDGEKGAKDPSMGGEDVVGVADEE